MRPRPSLILRFALIFAMLAALGACTSSAGKQSGAPSVAPSQAATEQATEEPTETPTDEPTEKPTAQPTPEPTEEPTPEPTEEPTPEPTEAPATLAGKFLARLSDPDLEASGGITGTMAMTVSGKKYSGTISGWWKAKAGDSAMSMTMSIAGQKTTTQAVLVGNDAYAKTGSSAWTKTARTETSGGVTSVFSANLQLKDAGVVTWKNKQVHKLSAGSAEGVDPSVLGMADTLSMTNIKIALNCYAKSDGTPAGMELTASWSQVVETTTVPVSMVMAYTFDKFTGVTITAPI